VKLSAVGVTARGIQILDRMGSGSAMAVDAAASIAFIVGFTYDAGKQTNMSLFGISLRDGRMAVNVSLPLPYWDDGDDHHTTVHLLRNGNLVVAGIAQGQGLAGCVTVVSRAGEVKKYHALDKLAFGEYPKGPTALDADGGNLYLAIASIGGGDWLMRLNLDSGVSSRITAPLEVMSLAYDTSRSGFWALASNATQILTDGYYIAFYDTASSTFGPIKALGRAACSSIENPNDNWNLASAFDDANGHFITREICQPDAGTINERVAVIDVATGSVLHRPLESALTSGIGLGLYGLAVESSTTQNLVV